MTVYHWVGIGLASVYGSASAWAGFMEIRRRTLPAWSAAGMLLGGMLLAVSSVTAVRIPSMGLVAISALLLLHLMAVANGMHMHGRLHMRHHLVRFVLSCAIAILLLA